MIDFIMFYARLTPVVLIAFVYSCASEVNNAAPAMGDLPDLILGPGRCTLHEEGDRYFRHKTGSHQDGAGRHRTEKEQRSGSARLRYRAASGYIGSGVGAFRDYAGS